MPIIFLSDMDPVDMSRIEWKKRIKQFNVKPMDDKISALINENRVHPLGWIKIFDRLYLLKL